MRNFEDNNKRLQFIRSFSQRNSWTNDEIKEFWAQVRVYISLCSFRCDLTNINFPDFEDITYNSNTPSLIVKESTFWFKNEEKLFDKEMDFSNSTFSGNAEFRDCHFLKTTYFIQTIFEKSAVFVDAIFEENTHFSSARFDKGATFWHTIFNGEETDFVFSNFEDEVFYNHTEFNTKIDFFQTNFRSFADFSNAVFKYVDFVETRFHEELDLSNSVFIESGNFDKTRFSLNHASSIQEVSSNSLKKDAPSLVFNDIFFNPKVVFRRTDLNKTSFYQCDVSKATFSECFNPDKRLVIFDESEEDYPALIELYRQFKLNFENNKDNELSAKAYRSEMLIRRKLMLENAKEKYFFSSKTIEWIIFWVYGRVSGFNQSFITPVMVLLCSTLLIFPLYYHYFENSSIANSFKKSVSATIPYFYKAEAFLKFQNWWVSSSQSLISSILLAFFIIALRKRFKQ